MNKEPNIIEKLMLDDLNLDDRESVKAALKLFCKYLTADKSITPQVWLQDLNKVINKFPKYCRPLRNDFEKYLIQFIDAKHFMTVLYAARCMLSLQMVRSQDQKDVSAELKWKDHAQCLCDVGHQVLNSIFSEQANVLGIFKDDVTATSQYAKALLNISESTSLENVTKLKQRLCNILIHLQVMLVDPYPFPKAVSPKHILQLVALVIELSSAENTNLDTEAIGDIKIQALRSVDSLVVCLHTALLPYNSLIIKLLINTLNWSEKAQDDDGTTVRIKAYDSLKRWLTVLRCHMPVISGNFNFESQLVKHIVTDIKHVKPVVQLQATNPTSKLSKKMKRKRAQASLAVSNLAARAHGSNDQASVQETDEDLYIAALKCAETFVLVCGLFMNIDHYQTLTKIVVKECFKYEEQSEAKTLHLCWMLEALRKSSPPTAKSITNYNIQLFSMLSNNKYTKLSDLATKALLDISIYLHYSPPSLSHPCEDQSGPKSRNEEALQEILGLERFNEIMRLRNNDLASEGTDEPSNKRARMSAELCGPSTSSDTCDGGMTKDQNIMDTSTEAHVGSNDENIESGPRTDEINTTLDNLSAGEMNLVEGKSNLDGGEMVSTEGELNSAEDEFNSSAGELNVSLGDINVAETGMNLAEDELDQYELNSSAGELNVAEDELVQYELNSSAGELNVAEDELVQCELNLAEGEVNSSADELKLAESEENSDQGEPKLTQDAMSLDECEVNVAEGDANNQIVELNLAQEELDSAQGEQNSTSTAAAKASSGHCNGFNTKTTASTDEDDLHNLSVTSDTSDKSSKMLTQDSNTTVTSEISTGSTQIRLYREHNNSKGVTDIVLSVPNTEGPSVDEMLKDFVDE